MGCFSGCLMSSAGIQKLFCGIYSVFKCSFDEFVGEKVVSLSSSPVSIVSGAWSGWERLLDAPPRAGWAVLPCQPTVLCVPSGRDPAHFPLFRRLRGRGCANCQSLPQAELFVRQRERPGLPSQAIAWPPRLSAGRRESGSQRPWLGDPWMQQGSARGQRVLSILALFPYTTLFRSVRSRGWLAGWLALVLVPSLSLYLPLTLALSLCYIHTLWKEGLRKHLHVFS